MIPVLLMFLFTMLTSGCANTPPLTPAADLSASEPGSSTHLTPRTIVETQTPAQGIQEETIQEETILALPHTNTPPVDPTPEPSHLHKVSTRPISIAVNQLPPTITYPTDSWLIQTRDFPKLAGFASFLNTYPTEQVTIEGHCDTQGTTAYNFVLGQKRAETAKEFLQNLGINPQRIEVISYGETVPLCSANTEPCHQQNRRSQFLLNTKG